jgi:hypothetical protein
MDESGGTESKSPRYGTGQRTTGNQTALNRKVTGSVCVRKGTRPMDESGGNKIQATRARNRNPGTKKDRKRDDTEEGSDRWYGD